MDMLSVPLVLKQGDATEEGIQGQREKERASRTKHLTPGEASVLVSLA
jgi:hypothetical protein